LLVLGLIIGLLNIADKEIRLFLVAVIALLAAGNVFAPLTALAIGEKLGDVMAH
jgi:hypothetical protein